MRILNYGKERLWQYIELCEGGIWQNIELWGERIMFEQGIVGKNKGTRKTENVTERATVRRNVNCGKKGLWRVYGIMRKIMTEQGIVGETN